MFVLSFKTNLGYYDAVFVIYYDLCKENICVALIMPRFPFFNSTSNRVVDFNLIS